MPITHAVILGIIQGLTEVLPISSSAHLVIIPWFLGWHYQGVAFDVALHMGTALAFILYFLNDWLKMLAGAFKPDKKSNGKLFWYIVAATFPAAAAGLLLEKKADEVFRSPWIILTMLAVFAIILWQADHMGKKNKSFEKINLASAIRIGCAQILALVPGVSRTGITITAGLFEGYSREAAARFSFFLATPIVLAAGLLKLHKLHAGDLTGAFWAGIISSAVCGFFSIKFFLNFVKRSSLNFFIFYRLIFAAVIIIALLARQS